MNRLHPIAGLIARLLFGLLVLALIFLTSAQLATHYFQDAAERAIRQVFTEGTETKSGVSYTTTCQVPEIGRERFSGCDPLVVKARHSLRSTACNDQGFLRLLGNRWSCVARFTDGATLEVDVSFGFGHRHLELLLPFRERGSPAGR
jgi:hypothetical protein